MGRDEGVGGGRRGIEAEDGKEEAMRVLREEEESGREG